MGYQFKVAAWNEEYVKYLAERMIKFLDEYYEDKGEFADEDGVNLQEDLAWDTSLERLLEDEELFGLVDTLDFEELSFAIADVFKQINKHYFDRMADEIREIYQDIVEYNKDPLGYYGMSQRDFL